VVLAEIPPDQGVRVLSTIDKMVDICLLAETMAYIENTVSCDIEVMSEVADRVRKPRHGYRLEHQKNAGQGHQGYRGAQDL